MKQLALVITILLLVSAAVADTSNPQGLPSASGDTSNSSYSNFQVVGEDVSGVVGNTSYVSGVGLAAMIFAPVLPNPSSLIPSVPSSVGVIIAYPSPFNPDSETATIAYTDTTDETVKIYILDISGAIIKTITANSANREADGYSRASWDGSSAFGGKVANGVYLINVVAGSRRLAKTKIVAYR